MKQRYYLRNVFFVAILLVAVACKKHSYYQENPNSPSVATPALLLPDISENTFNIWPMDAAYASRHMTYYERPSSYVQYNWSTSPDGYQSYDILRQVEDMNKRATATGEKNYQGLAKFFRAFHFIKLTETYGDVPYSESLKALENNVQPVYDTQEQVYAGALNELDEANTLLDPANGDLLGDIIYNGDVLQWKKLVNAFRLRVLIHLSKKEGSSTINIKQQFATIIGNSATYPLMESIADNAQIKFNTTAINNYYPIYQSNSVPSLAALEKRFVAILKDRQDPRLFKIAEPVTAMPANVFSSYEGVDAGLTVSDQNDASQGASKIARRYINDPVNEPMILLSYAEQELLIAEAIARNWITGDAALHYKNGITASMKFYDVADADITAYLAGPNVLYNPANAIPMIITQKYIAFFLNSGWEPFFEQLRTGIPVMSTGAGTQNGGKVPKRFVYPQSEFSYNAENVTAAVQRQYAGSDDINAAMWVIQ